jgi:hypothetical protein
MNVDPFESIFGRGRVKMATGDHVEVYREAAVPGERRRYTKRFLAAGGTDFRQWTDREWRILARLIGHGVRSVPAVASYHGGAEGGPSELQTYDAGVSVDQWATLLPVERDGVRRRSVLDDCAHWWALAHHCLAALDEIHALGLVHLDVKADNLCIPYAPASYKPADGGRLRVEFAHLALIDFAFSLVSRERLATSLPLGWQKDYDYQSPRLLRALEAGRAGDLVPTQELDWRCDLYSLAAMLRRYLPDEPAADGETAAADGWTRRRQDDARALIYRLRECHDGDDVASRPHRDLMALTAVHASDPALAQSVVEGWTLVRDAVFLEAKARGTPMTRIAAPVGRTRMTDVRTTVVVASFPGAPSVFRNPRAARGMPAPPTPIAVVPTTARRRASRGALLAAALIGAVALAVVREADGPRLQPPRVDLAAATLAKPAPAVVAPPVVAPPAAAEKDVDAAPPPVEKAVRASPRPAAPSDRVRPKPATAAPSSDRALALLQSPEAMRAPAVPYDPVAARRATARLAQQASRTPPASTLPAARPAPIVVARSDPPPPIADTLAPAVADATPIALPNATPMAPPERPPSTAPVVVRAPETPKPDRRTAERWRDRIHSALASLGLHDAPRAAPIEDRAPPRASRPAPATDADLASRGRRIVADMVPVVAAQAHTDAARPLDLASSRGTSLGSGAHASATNDRWRAESVYAPAAVDARRARELYEAARMAFAAGRTTDAIELDLQAFAANPRDPDIAGFLAFLHLRTQPVRAETARQLALHALAHGGRQRGMRFEDWNTFAVASALTGRQGDASRAYQLMAALADPERSCRAAMRAQAQFGEALRVPVEVLSQRLRRDGRADEAPGCSGALARMAAAPA